MVFRLSLTLLTNWYRLEVITFAYTFLKLSPFAHFSFVVISRETTPPTVTEPADNNNMQVREPNLNKWCWNKFRKHYKGNFNRFHTLPQRSCQLKEYAMNENCSKPISDKHKFRIVAFYNKFT